MTETQVWAVMILAFSLAWHWIDAWRHVRASQAAETILASIDKDVE